MQASGGEEQGWRNVRYPCLGLTLLYGKEEKVFMDYISHIDDGVGFVCRPTEDNP